MVQTVLEGLDVVAKTRLLGRDPELYAEVDGNRAAVEFDLAIALPLLALAVGVGARSDPLVFALFLALGTLFAWGCSGMRSARRRWAVSSCSNP